VVVHFVMRQGSRDFRRHLVTPVIGTIILGYVIFSANVPAQRVGLIRLALRIVTLAVLYLVRRAPRLEGTRS
jgi:hypothetical protein